LDDISDCIDPLVIRSDRKYGWRVDSYIVGFGSSYVVNSVAIRTADNRLNKGNYLEND
jgi:hypothetical protein